MKLIFVYNANSGKLNSLFDIAHKIIKPETYACSLCSLTHGNFTEKQAWRDFRETGSVEMSFYHKDEFEIKYKKKFSYPVILKDEENLDILLTDKQLNSFSGLDELIAKLQQIISNQ